MRVVRHAVDRNRGHFLVAADACQIRPEFRLDILGDGGLTILCAEDEMDVIFDERVRHGLCRPFRALILTLTLPTAHAVGSIISPCGLGRGLGPNTAMAEKCPLPVTWRRTDAADGRSSCEK